MTTLNAKDLNVQMKRICKDNPKDVRTILFKRTVGLRNILRRDTSGLIKYSEKSNTIIINVDCSEVTLKGTIGEALSGFSNLMKFNMIGIDAFFQEADNRPIYYDSMEKVENSISPNTTATITSCTGEIKPRFSLKE